MFPMAKVVLPNNCPLRRLTKKMNMNNPDRLSPVIPTGISDNTPLKGVRGAMLTFKANPFLCPEEECFDYYDDALIVMRGGRIIDVGNYVDVIKRNPAIDSIDVYSDVVIMPGFVDCHAHYVQSPMIASYGGTLLEWLEQRTFPAEAMFRDRMFADEAARVFMRQILEQGTTTANLFSTTFACSVDAIFEEAGRYDARIITGKVLQDRNLPDILRDSSAEESVALSEELLLKWHGRGRLLYAVVPRFAPTSTPRQLRLAGELYQRYIDRGVYMHTHLDESQGEIDFVRELFPEAASYTDLYRRFGLTGCRSVMAHCCIVREDEWQMLHDDGCGVAHCPSSNLFLGDGEFRYWEAADRRRPVGFGIGTDVGGGTNFSVLRQLGDAHKVAMLHSRGIDAVRGLYMATRGGAEVLRLADRIGAIAPGYEADLAVIDLNPSEFAQWRLGFSASIFEKLFTLLTLGPDNLNRATYVAGRKVYDRTRTPRWLYADEA